jgi:hypothetical protein
MHRNRRPRQHTPIILQHLRNLILQPLLALPTQTSDPEYATGRIQLERILKRLQRLEHIRECRGVDVARALVEREVVERVARLQDLEALEFGEAGGGHAGWGEGQDVDLAGYHGGDVDEVVGAADQAVGVFEAGREGDVAVCGVAVGDAAAADDGV